MSSRFVFKFIVMSVVALLSAVLVIGCSSPKVPLTEIKVGDSLPEIRYRTIDNSVFNLNEFVKKNPTVLVYYRGGWCPYCNDHHKELRKIEKNILERGYTLLAISPDSVTELQKTKAFHSMDYILLSDSTMEGAKALGIAFEVDTQTVERYKSYNIDLEAASGHSHHLLPKPTVMVISSANKVSFVHINDDYKKRLSNNDLLRALK